MSTDMMLGAGTVWVWGVFFSLQVLKRKLTTAGIAWLADRVVVEDGFRSLRPLKVKWRHHIRWRPHPRGCNFYFSWKETFYYGNVSHSKMLHSRTFPSEQIFTDDGMCQ